MRRPLIAGNWKMHKTAAEARALAAAVAELADALPAVDTLVAPPFTALAAVAEQVRGSRLGVAAQDMHWADQGAFTGAIAPSMVAEWATAVILGHSERRHLFGETDLAVNRKVHAAFAHGLVPILCLGETEGQRDAGQTETVVLGQLDAGLEGIAPEEAARAVLAYEPVWAIGTGRACEPGEAGRVMGLLRARVGDRFGPEAAGAMRLLYGGSVQGDNAGAYLAQADVDGALVGGASLSIEAFAPIARAGAARAQG